MSRHIVSCCYAPKRPGYYGPFADRLEESLRKCAGTGVGWTIWRDGWPPGSPSHQEVNYGFKWYAVNHAYRSGHRRVIWFDAGTELLSSAEYLWDLVEREGVGLLKGAGALGRWISDACLQHFGYTREKAFELKLFGGCFVGINFDHPKGMEFFSEWESLAKNTNYFMCSSTNGNVEGALRSVPLIDSSGTPVSLDERVEGHRSDESCFSIMADRMKIEPINLIQWQDVARTY